MLTIWQVSCKISRSVIMIYYSNVTGRVRYFLPERDGLAMKRLSLPVMLSIAALIFGTIVSQNNVFSQEIKKRTLASDRAVLKRWEKRIRSIIQKGELPIIDTQATYGKLIDIPEFIEYMDELGVALVVFAPKFKDPLKGSGQSLELFKKHPDFFVPATTDGTTQFWFDQRELYINKIEEEVRSGYYYFMGEHELRHYMSHRQYKDGKIWRNIKIPPDTPLMHRIFKLSSKSRITFQIHNDPEDGFLEPLERMLGQYPDAKVIWCHMGKIRYPERQTVYSPAYVDKLLEKYQNLYFDLANASPGVEYPGSGFVDNTLQQLDGALEEPWKAVIEKHPTRFTIGSDIGPGKWLKFPDRIEQARDILSDLSPSTAGRVAYKNAWFLITRTKWVD